MNAGPTLLATVGSMTYEASCALTSGTTTKVSVSSADTYDVDGVVTTRAGNTAPTQDVVAAHEVTGTTTIVATSAFAFGQDSATTQQFSTPVTVTGPTGMHELVVRSHAVHGSRPSRLVRGMVVPTG